MQVKSILLPMHYVMLFEIDYLTCSVPEENPNFQYYLVTRLSYHLTNNERAIANQSTK